MSVTKGVLCMFVSFECCQLLCPVLLDLDAACKRFRSHFKTEGGSVGFLLCAYYRMTGTLWNVRSCDSTFRRIPDVYFVCLSLLTVSLFDIFYCVQSFWIWMQHVWGCGLSSRPRVGSVGFLFLCLSLYLYLHVDFQNLLWSRDVILDLIHRILICTDWTLRCFGCCKIWLFGLCCIFVMSMLCDSARFAAHL